MSPHRHRTVLHRLPLVLALALPAAALAACGDEPRDEPTSYLLTDLEGGTAAPGDIEPSAETPSATESPSDPRGGEVSGSELVARVGAAMGAFGTVEVTLGNASPPPDFVIGLDYATGTFTLRVPPIVEGGPTIEARRIDGRLFFTAGDGDGWAVIEPDDPRLETASGILPAVFAFDLLADLRATLQEGDALESLGTAEVDGTEVEQYRLELDTAELTQPSLTTQTPGATGESVVTVSLDETGLPVRIDYDVEPGTISRLDFSSWGDDVTVEVPPLG